MKRLTKHPLAFSLLTSMVLLGARPGSAAPLFFEDFKDGAANWGPSYYTNDGEGVVTVVTTGTELLECLSTNADPGGGDAFGIEYPRVGTLTWDTAQNQYLQAFVPWKGGTSDLISLQFQVDGGSWTGDIWQTRIDNAEIWHHSQPTLVDINAMAALTPGVHQLKMRLVVINTIYDSEPGLSTMGYSADWIKGGMSPSSDIAIGDYKDDDGNATPAKCAHVAPPHGVPLPDENRPVLKWTPPVGYSNLTYIVTFSQDPWFRGPTTHTVHGVTDTSLKVGPLALGTWYWTVIPVNSDDICGQQMIQSMSGFWHVPEDYHYYSFEVTSLVPTELSEYMFE